MDREQRTNREQKNNQKVNAEAFLMNEKYPFIPLSFHGTYGTDTQHNKGTFQRLGTFSWALTMIEGIPLRMGCTNGSHHTNTIKR